MRALRSEEVQVRAVSMQQPVDESGTSQPQPQPTARVQFDSAPPREREFRSEDPPAAAAAPPRAVAPSVDSERLERLMHQHARDFAERYDRSDARSAAVLQHLARVTKHLETGKGAPPPPKAPILPTSCPACNEPLKGGHSIDACLKRRRKNIRNYERRARSKAKKQPASGGSGEPGGAKAAASTEGETSTTDTAAVCSVSVLSAATMLSGDDEDELSDWSAGEACAVDAYDADDVAEVFALRGERVAVPPQVARNYATRLVSALARQADVADSPPDQASGPKARLVGAIAIADAASQSTSGTSEAAASLTASSGLSMGTTEIPLPEAKEDVSVQTMQVTEAVRRHNEHFELYGSRSVSSAAADGRRATTMRCVVTVRGPAGDTRKLTLLIDGGAEVTVFSLDALPPSCVVRTTQVSLSGAFAGRDPRCGRTRVEIENDGVSYPVAHGFTTSAMKGYDGILGIDWLRRARVQIAYSLVPTEEQLLVEGVHMASAERGVYRWTYNYYRDRMKCSKASAAAAHEVHALEDDVRGSAGPLSTVRSSPRVICAEEPIVGDATAPCKPGPEDTAEESDAPPADGESAPFSFANINALQRAATQALARERAKESGAPSQPAVASVRLRPDAAGPLNGFHLQFTEGLLLPARKRMMIPVRMQVPHGLERASGYIVDGAPVLDRRGVLVAATRVAGDDLDLWQIEMVNPRVHAVHIHAGVDVLRGEREWADALDESTVSAEMEEVRSLALRVAALATSRADPSSGRGPAPPTGPGPPSAEAKTNDSTPAAKTRRSLGEMAKALGHSDGWRGERFDPSCAEDVQHLLHELGYDAMLLDVDPLKREKKRKVVLDLFMHFLDVFAKDALLPGRSDFEPMDIPLKNAHQRPVRSAPYR